MKLRKLCIFTLFICLLAAPAQAGTANAGADFLVEIGERELRNGNVEMALHEFSKALMLDPEHEEALAYLREYGHDEGLYTGARTYRSDMAQLSKKFKHIQNNVAQAKAMQQQAHEDMLKAKAQRDNMSRELTAKNLKVYELRSELAKAHCQLDEKEAKLQNQFEEVKDIYNDMAKMHMSEFGLTTEELGMVHAYENELIKLQSKHNQLREAKFKEFARKDVIYDEMDDYVLIRHKVINDLKDELLYREINMMHMQEHVIQKLNEIEEAQNRLLDAHGQIDSRDELLEKKHQELMKLKDELSQAMKEYDKTAKVLEAKLNS